jgi:hypothetical protein
MNNCNFEGENKILNLINAQINQVKLNSHINADY